MHLVSAATRHDVTYAEMDPAEKNAISHRARAFQKLEAAFA